MASGGSYPPESLRLGPAATSLVTQMQSDGLRDAIAAKFGLDLAGAPVMLTMRGRTREKDGRIHTDSTAKRVTVLLYLNPQTEAWAKQERLPPPVAQRHRPRGFRRRGSPGERHAAGISERPHHLARPPHLRRPAPRDPAQLHDERRPRPQRAAPPSLVRLHQALRPQVTLLNWLLGGFSLVIWFGVFGYYFKDDIKRFWPSRYDKWFRGD